MDHKKGRGSDDANPIPLSKKGEGRKNKGKGGGKRCSKSIVKGGVRLKPRKEGTRLNGNSIWWGKSTHYPSQTRGEK